MWLYLRYVSSHSWPYFEQSDNSRLQFFFVASFHRSGVVKYVANGITIRSTIERSVQSSQWLDQNGELMQVLVLQNYLFFANANSVLSYISSMFEEVKNEVEESLVVPIPSIVILDMSLVTGTQFLLFLLIVSVI